MSAFAFPSTTWYTRHVPDGSVAGVRDSFHRLLSNPGIMSASLGRAQRALCFPGFMRGLGAARTRVPDPLNATRCENRW